MELEKFEKAAKIVNEIRQHQWYLEQFKQMNTNDLSGFYLYKNFQEGMRNFDIKVPLPKNYVNGLVLSVTATYKRIIKDLYEELDKI